jgi:type II secretory pathway pseudopilin PulG
MRGTTLVELMVVLLLLAVVTGISGFALAGLRPPADTAERQRLVRARTAVLRSGRAVTLELRDGRVVRFLPDGRALGPGLDPFTGEVLDAKR